MKHPGVKIKTRGLKSGKVTHIARWTDPDTGKEVDRSLDRLGLTSNTARERWAARKSKKIAARRADIEAGAPKRTQTTFKKAVDDYLEGRGLELSEATLRTYSKIGSLIVAWAADQKIRFVEQLDGLALDGLRRSIVAQPRQTQATGAARGARRKQERKRDARTINRQLQELRTLLNHLRRLGQIPKLDSDAIKDGLRSVKGQRKLPVFLKSPEIRELINAAKRHDREAFRLTRAEKRGKGRPGATARFQQSHPSC